VHELGLAGKTNLRPHLRSLEEKKFIDPHFGGEDIFSRS